MKKGFTLIEVMVTAIILAFVLAGVGAYLQASSNIVAQGVLESRAQNELFMIYNNIAKNIREGSRVKDITISGVSGIAILDENDVIQTVYGDVAGQLYVASNTAGIPNVNDFKKVPGTYKSLDLVYDNFEAGDAIIGYRTVRVRIQLTASNPHNTKEITTVPIGGVIHVKSNSIS